MNAQAVKNPFPHYFTVEESALLTLCPEGSRTDCIAALTQLLPLPSHRAGEDETGPLVLQTIHKLQRLTDEGFSEAYRLYDEQFIKGE